LNGEIINMVEQRCAPTKRRRQISGAPRAHTNEFSIEVRYARINLLTGHQQRKQKGQDRFAL
jgi:hypothetical protein